MIHWFKGKREARRLAKLFREQGLFIMAEVMELYGRWFVWRRMKKLKALIAKSEQILKEK